MDRKKQIAKYLFFDIVSANISWTIFYILRKITFETSKFGYQIPIEFTDTYFLSLVFIPVYWVFLHMFSGYYKDIYRKSRLNELWQTLQVSLFGVLIIFFALLLDDEINSYRNYYLSFVSLFSLQFALTYVPRLIITTRTNHKIHKGKIGFNTIIIGSNEGAISVFNEIENQSSAKLGNKFIGFVNVNGSHENSFNGALPRLGNIHDLPGLIEQHKIEEVIIAIETEEHDKIGRIINILAGCKVIIKAIPNMYDILTGKVKMNQIYGMPLILVSHELMQAWQQNLKQIIDYSVAFLALTLTSPLCLFLIIAIKISSKGPVIYMHERIGKYGRPFYIYKFRSMFIDAEQHGPALSSKNDARITRIGRFMRKSRLDEIPNFVNVLKGDMSLVGPRPERQYYIDQIVQKAPHYVHLHKIKPGITSWGQVKYGYAENVDQMVERLKYDILYIENMSLYVDFKILIYTVLTIIRGRGV
jgi:exopolysaccharide biosynthesis polyprenyl glycosylphosphotransferase